MVTKLSQYGIIGDGRQALADNGVVLLANSNSIVLWRNGGTVSTGYTISPLAARLNRSATLFVAETVTSGGAHRLAAYDLGNRRRETASGLRLLRVRFRRRSRRSFVRQ
jgi:hypothetical protein